jgi:DNA-binding PadR family transcriptional regulator
VGFGRDILRGSLDLMVLSILAEGPQYGYLILQRLREASRGQVELKAGTLYPILHRLEAAGSVKSRWDDSTGRDRKWYQLTPKGQRALRHEAEAWYAYSECIQALLTPALRTL